jgi:hypothetical protein
MGYKSDIVQWTDVSGNNIDASTFTNLLIQSLRLINIDFDGANLLNDEARRFVTDNCERVDATLLAKYNAEDDFATIKELHLNGKL